MELVVFGYIYPKKSTISSLDRVFFLPVTGLVLTCLLSIIYVPLCQKRKKEEGLFKKDNYEIQSHHYYYYYYYWNENSIFVKIGDR